jgi:peptidyl-dipeptidase Dcp
MAEITQQLDENLLAETNAFELHVDSKEGLEELPEGLIAGAVETAKERGHDVGWSLTLNRPSINPFLQSATDRSMRKQMFDAYAMRGDNDNANDNKALMEEQVNIRLKKANLLGYKTYANYSLTKAMAQTPEKVFALMDQLWAHKTPMLLQSF